MERIDSAASTLSDLNLPPVFVVGDRVRRVGTGLAGTVRYVGPLLHGTTTATTTSTGIATATTATITSTGSSDTSTGTAATGTSPPTSGENSRSAAAPVAAGMLHSVNLPPVDSLQELGASGAADSNAPSPTMTAGLSPLYYPHVPGSVSAATAAFASPADSQNTYVGVEWDKPDGKNDGTVLGIRYFYCKPNYGSLLPAKNLASGITLCRALEARYGSSSVRQENGVTPESVANRTATKPMQLGPALGMRDDHGAFIKVVSSDCTANDTLRLVSTVGENLGRLFPNLRDLSLASTLFASWGEIALVGAELPSLQTLDVSRNLPLANPSLSALAIAQRNNTGDKSGTAKPMPISVSVKELRMSDIGSMTPECVEQILSVWFPSLELLFAARNNLTLEGSPLQQRPVPRAIPPPTPSSASASSLSTSPSAGAGGNHSRYLSTSSSSNNANSSSLHDDNGNNNSSSTKPPSSLTYLNVEGNPLESLDDIARLLGTEQRCLSLKALNVSATRISDAVLMPDVHPGMVYQQQQQLGRSLGGSASSSTTGAGSNSPGAGGGGGGGRGRSESPPSSPGDAGGVTKSPQKSPGGGNGAVAAVAAAAAASCSSVNLGSLMKAQAEEPPLFPNLQSLYMNKVPVVSWASLSRLLHRAALCDGTLQDVHFTTCAQDQKEKGENNEDDDEGNGDDSGNNNNNDDTSSMISISIEKEHCFLPEDLRDRRRLTVAFMPPGLKKLNRSEITAVERAGALQRSIPTFASLVKKSEREQEQEDAEKEADRCENEQQQQQQEQQQQQQQQEEEKKEEEEEEDMFAEFCPRRFGQLPYHLQKAIVNEHAAQKARGAGGRFGGGGVPGGPGYIYHPPPGPRKMINELSINMRPIFLLTHAHLTNLEREGFRSILCPPENTMSSQQQREHQSSSASLAASSSSVCSLNSPTGGSSSGVASAAAPSKGHQNIIPLQIDVRWETQQLEEAVRAALGLSAAATGSSSSSAKKVVVVQMIHIDKELMDNPGAVAQRLHLKKLTRPWEKLHMSRFAAGDDLLVLIGP